MGIENDHALLATLRYLGIGPSAFVARGGEAAVFRFGPDKIVRVGHAWVTAEYVERRRALLAELAALGSLSFEIPSVEQVLSPCGRVTTVEPWFAGRPLNHALRDAAPPRRERLLVAALDASLELGQLPFERPNYCDLYWDPATRHQTWRGYLALRAERSLSKAGGAYARLDPRRLAAPFEELPPRRFLHFDLYPGNLLVEHERVSAVLDFSGMSMCGDPNFDPVSLAVYAGAEMTGARDGNVEVCRRWLGEHDLLETFHHAEPVLAAIWSFAQDDPVVAQWTRRVLLGTARYQRR